MSGLKPTRQVDGELHEKLVELLKDDLCCERVWEAWQYGTMTQDDFAPLNGTERVDELLQLFTAHFQAAVKDIKQKLDDYCVEIHVDGESRWTQVVYWDGIEEIFEQLNKSTPNQNKEK